MTLVDGIDPVEAMDRIQLATLRAFAQLPGAEMAADTDVAYGTSGAPLPPLNTVTGARFTDADADGRISAVDEWFTRRGMPYTWFVGPADTPGDLAERLLARGLVEDPEGAPGMVARLDGLADEMPPDDLTIEPATNAETWNVVCDLMVEGFQAPPVLGTVLRGLAEVGFRDDDPWRAWVVRRGGAPAGTALGLVDADALGIFNVATVEGHRRQGVGRAATLAAMRFGAERGCRIAVLQTSPLGRSVYSQLGFEEYGMYRVFVRLT